MRGDLMSSLSFCESSASLRLSVLIIFFIVILVIFIIILLSGFFVEVETCLLFIPTLPIIFIFNVTDILSQCIGLVWLILMIFGLEHFSGQEIRIILIIICHWISIPGITFNYIILSQGIFFSLETNSEFSIIGSPYMYSSSFSEQIEIVP